ncbi:MAG: NADPH:quinone oxidoreductase family protein [Pseudomonadota bacterium]
MRRFVVRSFDQAPQIERYSPKPLQPGQIAIAIKHAALNHADLLMMAGRYQDTPKPPFALGLEGAGIVMETNQVSRFAVGDRVATFAGHGCLADQVNVDQNRVVAVPDGLDLCTAAAVPIAYATAHLGLVRRARAQSGNVLLVTGAGGGSGLAAVRLGAALGLQVIATARSEAHRKHAQEAGADQVFDSEIHPEEVTARLRDLGGVNVVFDTVGGDGLGPILRAVRPEGQVLMIGFVGGQPTFKPNHLLVKNQTIAGLNISAYVQFAPDALLASLEAVMDLAASGAITADIGHRFDFEQVPSALAMLADRKANGKIIIDIV